MSFACNHVTRFLEQKIQEMEVRHGEELESLREEKVSLQELVAKQNHVIQELENQLGQATGNNTALQRQQQELTDTVQGLLNLCSKDGGMRGPGCRHGAHARLGIAVGSSSPTACCLPRTGSWAHDASQPQK